MEHYIYEYRDDDEVVYVGHGKYDRAWRIHYENKDLAEWQKSKYPDLPVHIIGKGMSKKDACKEEKQLITLYKPKFNKYKRDHGTILTADQKNENCDMELGKRGRKSGDNEFPTQQDLADSYGVSLRTIKKVRLEGRRTGAEKAWWRV